MENSIVKKIGSVDVKNHPWLLFLNNLFKFYAQDSDLEYLFWHCKNPPVYSDIKPHLNPNLEILLSQDKILSKYTFVQFHAQKSRQSIN